MLAEALVALALSRALASPMLAPQQTVSVGGGGGIACATVTRAEMRQRGAKGVTMTLCLELFRGEVLGHVITKAGALRCTVYGVFDFATRCGVVTSCGVPVTTCL